jgi:hypothetical protein
MLLRNPSRSFRCIGRKADAVTIAVNTSGPTSTPRLTLRLLLYLFVPVLYNVLLDLLWLGGDEQGQSLRDKIAGVYVARKQAEPIARGRIDIGPFFLLGCSPFVPQVQRRRRWEATSHAAERPPSAVAIPEKSEAITTQL